MKNQTVSAEVLLMDRDPSIRAALRDLLGKLGFLTTAIEEPELARRLAAEKFFAVCLVDLDTPEAGKGVEVIRQLRSVAPISSVLALAPRASYSLAVEAFRAGAADVILKSPEGVDQLRRRVVQATRDSQRAIDRDRLLQDMKDLTGTLMEKLVQASRQASELEERASGSHSLSQSDSICKVLYVDDDEHAFEALDAELRRRPGFAAVGVASGGAALDYAGSERYPVILIKEGLPDLPAPLVGRSVRDLSPESVVALFQPLSGKGGQFRVLERPGEEPVALVYEGIGGLAQRVSELREAQMLRTRERRYLRSFREQNLELLRHHADVRRRMELLGDGSAEADKKKQG